MPRTKLQPQWKRPRVGLALSGGAARGTAHVGVLKVLVEHGVPIDYVAGTSAGSLVGGAFAAGVSLKRLTEFGRTMRWRDFGKLTFSRLGVQSNARMEQYVRAHLPVTQFEDMPIPFAVVATDLHSGEPVVLRDKGDVAFAIRASCAVPGWYVPVTDEHGRQLVDGGLVANVPSEAARALGADIVIAVDVNAEGAKFLGPPQSAIGVLFQSFLFVQRAATAHQWQAADVVIVPKVGHIRWDDMTHADELIAAGEQATLACLDEIKALLAPPPAAVAAPTWLQRLLRRAGGGLETQLPATSPRADPAVAPQPAQLERTRSPHN